MPFQTPPMSTSYDYRLVALSVVIAMAASYVALDLAGRVTSARGRSRGIWLFGGATAMGFGIWSMHYVGMLALNLPTLVKYDWPTVLLSLLAAIFASATALFIVSRASMNLRRASAGSLLMGGAIAGMHYIGMAAMRLTATCYYSPILVTVSIVLAIVISFVALWLSFHLRGERNSRGWKKAWCAVVMGAAIPVMHYTGMAAAVFVPSSSVSGSLVHALSISELGTFGIIVITFMVLGLTLLTSITSSSLALKASVVTMFGWAVYETAKETLMHNHPLTAWESHSISIIVSGIVASLSAFFVLRAREALHHALTIEIEERKSAQARLSSAKEAAEAASRRLASQALELEASEKRFRAVFEGAQIGIAITELSDGRITAINPAYLKMLECTADEMRSVRVFDELTHVDYRETDRRRYQALLAGEYDHIQFEKRHLLRSGREAWVVLDLSVLRDSTGTPQFVLGMAVDITERKRAEEASNEKAEMIRLLLESAPEAIFGVDQQGNGTFCNAAFLRLTGYKHVGEVLGQNIHKLIHHTKPDGSVYPVEECHIYEAFRRGTSIHVADDVLWRKDGTSFPAEYWSRPLHRGGDVIGSVATFLDVTERRQAERALRDAKEAAEAANRAKSTFLATMSHEIRTPMNGILGMTELVLDTDLTQEQRENLGLVRLSAESLLSIINDILDFSKIEAGKLEIEAIPFDLRESLGESMQSLSVRAHQKGLELIYDVQPEVPEALIGDPGRIRQILVNLVGNSIKFTEKGEVFVQVQEESQAESVACLHFAVKDTGIGIPQEKQQTIFEAFSQVDGSMARKYGGTGLGLTICTRLVTMMGGAIWVESQPGQGSTFHFTVRLALQDKPCSAPALLEPQQLRDMHALIVDDNFTNRTVLSGMLTRWGMRPTAVEGGRAALQALQVARSTGRPFPLILLDGQMPEMDGFTLAERITKDPELVGATIMMLTSAGHLGDAARCRELGISVYLVKPVRQGELLQALCSVLNLASPKQAPLVTRHTLREAKNRARVLLAEDNPVNQTLATRLLEKRGYVVSLARNGREATEAIEREEFDVVLMDVQMPDMDGFEATAAIRKREEITRNHLPIIAMTAHALKGDEERCLQAGMDGYVSKPIRTHELFAAIENAIGGFQASRNEEAVSDVPIKSR